MQSTLKPKQVVKQLTAVLPERVRDIITSRYGLGESPEKMTLEAIGKRYGITRERVRQIENYALQSIRKSSAYAKAQPSFEELRRMVDERGGIVLEEDFLSHMAKDGSTRNHV